MNNIYLRKKDNLKNITFKVILALMPLLIAGFYKNGIRLYLDGYVSLKVMFKPLVLAIFGFLIGILVNIIFGKITKEDKPIKEMIFSSFHPLYGLLISSIISINIKIWLFILVTFSILFLSKFIKESRINIMALSALLIIFITNIIGKFTFLNLYEQANTLHLVALDYLIGRGSGGINTSNVLLLVLSLFILCNIKSYKKEIPLYSSIIYSTCMILYCIGSNTPGTILDNIFSNGILFSFVFIATDPLSSSYTSKGKMIYSIIIGLVTFGLFLIYPPLSSLGGIIIASISHNTIDKLCQRSNKL